MHPNCTKASSEHPRQQQAASDSRRGSKKDTENLKIGMVSAGQSDPAEDELY
jgi:hypothetical protein